MNLRNTPSGAGSWLSKAGMILLAVLVVGPWEGAKRLNERVFNKIGGWEGSLVYAALTFWGSVSSAIWAGEFAKAGGHSALVYVPAGFLGLAVSIAYACPLLWLSLGNPLWHGLKGMWDGIGKYAGAHFETGSSSFVNFFAHLPGSTALWSKVNAPERKSYLAYVVKAVLYPTFVLGSGWLAYNIFQYAHGLATGYAGLAASALGGVAGLYAFAAVCRVLTGVLSNGKLPGLAILLALPAAGAAAVYSTATWNVGSGAVALAATTVLGLAYVVPGVLLVFSDHLLNWIINTLKPLLESAYSQAENPARRLGGQIVNLSTTAAAFYGLHLLCATIGMPLWGSVLTIGGFTALAYTLGGKIWDGEGGNGFSGALASAVAAIFAGLSYHNAGLMFGAYGSIGAGVVSGLLTGCLVFPLALIAWQKVTGWLPSLTQFFSSALVGMHNAFWSRFEKLTSKCEQIYSWGYRSTQTDFNSLTLQLTNVVLTFGIPTALYLGFPGYVHAHALLGGVGLALTGAFTYLLIGKLLVKSGVELSGGIAAIAAGIISGVYLAPLQSLHYALAAPAAVFIAGLVFFIGYPAALIAGRWVLDPWATKLLLPLLNGLFQACWKVFGVWWDGFLKVYDGLLKLLGYVFGWLAPYWTGFINVCRAAWQSTFGR